MQRSGAWGGVAALRGPGGGVQRSGPGRRRRLERGNGNTGSAGAAAGRGRSGAPGARDPGLLHVRPRLELEATGLVPPGQRDAPGLVKTYKSNAAAVFIDGCGAAELPLLRSAGESRQWASDLATSPGGLRHKLLVPACRFQPVSGPTGFIFNKLPDLQEEVLESRREGEMFTMPLGPLLHQACLWALAQSGQIRAMPEFWQGGGHVVGWTRVPLVLGLTRSPLHVSTHGIHQTRWRVTWFSACRPFAASPQLVEVEAQTPVCRAVYFPGTGGRGSPASFFSTLHHHTD
ncbi:PREDICTED: uncharacterized protein LOC102856500 [Elephantulus edwardii]|uniref:uncharacterized protein LOC102856500 n=1 Tax=Elephantulus edwardii TaxID=28737 RepID=UPI0003F0C460|nr:PREDICTED: uncharacterized protein LOC102856500 [Elephantulus edwardii]